MEATVNWAVRINTLIACTRAWVLRSGSLSLALLFTAGLIACSKPETITEIRRGRLSCTEKVERRRVNNYWWEVFIDGRPFIPEGRDSNKVGQCQASRNPNVNVLVVLLGDNCWTLRLDGENPLFKPIEKPDGMDSIEQFKIAKWSCDGHCLVWPTQLSFVDRSEVRKFSRLPSDFIGLAPDLKTAVTEGVNEPETNKFSIKLVDLESSTVKERTLTRANYLWLLDYTAGVEAIAERFKWERGADGKDQLIYPAEETSRVAVNETARRLRHSRFCSDHSLDDSGAVLFEQGRRQHQSIRRDCVCRPGAGVVDDSVCDVSRSLAAPRRRSVVRYRHRMARHEQLDVMDTVGEDWMSCESLHRSARVFLHSAVARAAWRGNRSRTVVSSLRVFL